MDGLRRSRSIAFGGTGWYNKKRLDKEVRLCFF